MARDSEYYYGRASYNLIVCVINSVVTVWAFRNDSDWGYLNLAVAIISFIFMVTNVMRGGAKSFAEEEERTRRYFERR